MIAGVALSSMLALFLATTSLSLKKERSSLKEKRRELLALRDEYISLKASLDSAGAGRAQAKSAGIVQAVDELFRSAGLSQKVKSVKSTGAREKKYSTEEEAELQIEKVSMNEMANLFYRIGNGPFLLSVRRSAIKTNFENPALLNITMTIDLIRPK